MERKVKNVVRDELVRFFKKRYNMDLSPAKIKYEKNPNVDSSYTCKFKFKDNYILEVYDVIVNETELVSFGKYDKMVY